MSFAVRFTRVVGDSAYTCSGSMVTRQRVCLHILPFRFAPPDTMCHGPLRFMFLQQATNFDFASSIGSSHHGLRRRILVSNSTERMP